MHSILLGLGKEKRGERDAAWKFFELSVKEDPALRWPAYFAKQMLAGDKRVGPA